MGNHEFCTGCYENDFHNGKSCQEAYPESYKKVQAEKVIHQDERRRGLILLQELKKSLIESGHSYVSIDHGDSYDSITITGFALVRAKNYRLLKGS